MAAGHFVQAPLHCAAAQVPRLLLGCITVLGNGTHVLLTDFVVYFLDMKLAGAVVAFAGRRRRGPKADAVHPSLGHAWRLTGSGSSIFLLSPAPRNS